MTDTGPLNTVTLLLRRGISPRYCADGMWVINQKCIRQYRCEWSHARKHDIEAKPVAPDLHVRSGDILINSTGVGTLGRVAPIRHEVPGATTVDGHVTIVRPDPAKVDPSYLGWVLVASQWKIERMGEGATGQTELSARRLGNEIEVPLPRRSVQRCIASILGAYDDLIEINRRRIALLEEMARRLFEEWFVRFRFPGHEHCEIIDTVDGPRPQDWQFRQIGELTSFLSRGITPKYDDAAAALVIGQKCIRDGRLSLAPARKQSRTVQSDKLVQPGDILINSTGVGTLGRVAQAETTAEGLTVDTHVTLVRARTDVDRDFFGLALLRLEPTFERLGAGATGQTELNRSRIASTILLEPPSELQFAFGRYVRPLRALAFQLAKQNEILASSRDLLVPRLISGELSLSAAERELETAA